jgi:hypothetical protein
MRPQKPPLGHAPCWRWTVYKLRGWWYAYHPHYTPSTDLGIGYCTWREAMECADHLARALATTQPT